MIGIIIIIEGALLAIITLLYISKIVSFKKRHLEVQHIQLNTFGQTLALSGTIIILVIPRVLNIQSDYSTNAALRFLFIITVGFFIFVAGLQLLILSYKTDVPRWIKMVMKSWE